MSDNSNSFKSMKPNMKQVYSDGKELKFKRLKGLLKKGKGEKLDSLPKLPKLPKL